MSDCSMPSDSVEKREITFESPVIMWGLMAAIVVFFVGGRFLFNVLWDGRESLLQLDVPMWVKLTSILLAILVHEGIHGLVFALYAPRGFKSVSFGFSKTMGSPYCHCADAIKVKHYRRAGIAPFIILGLFPLLFGLITGVQWITTFGLLLSGGGFGDLFVWIYLFRFDSNVMVRDHPEKMGFIIENP